MKYKTIRQSFSVPYEYHLYFTEGIFHKINGLFLDIVKGYGKDETVKLLFVVDKGVCEHHPKLLSQINDYCFLNAKYLAYTKSLIIEGGEKAKNNMTNVDVVLEAINENAICRHSFVIAIGGGALIDMVGYAATIAHRGVKLIRVPTTVLSQNDAAVGVKNSINAFGKKNFLGTFAPPYAIINDSYFLKTLEQRDWISGIAEAIKVALIKDKDFFEFIAGHALQLKERDMDSMHYVIHKCAEMHMNHISQGGDPFESGSSRPLDFGHWAAHKLEHMTCYELRHGEAVAKGIALDVTYAQLTGLISEEDLHYILNVLFSIGFDITIPLKSYDEIEELLGGIQEFREHLGGQLTITLLAKIGTKHDVHSIDMNLMRQSIKKLNRILAEK